MNSFLTVEIVLKVTILVLITLGLRYLARHAAPSLRHFIGLSSLLAVLAVPVLVSRGGFQTTVKLPQEVPVQVSRSVGVEIPQPASRRLRERPVDAFAVPWKQIIFIMWLTGFALIGVRYAGGLLGLWLVRTRPFERTGIGLPRRARVVIATDDVIRSPMTWGVFRPVIVLPMEAESWSVERVEAVLLHELAHVRRRDFASQALTELACAVYWFHPMVWVLARHIRSDAELAADQAVLAAGIPPTDYATELVQIAVEMGTRRPTLSRIGVSIMNQPKIEQRLNALLTGVHHRGATSIQLLVTAALAILAASGIASLQVEVVPSPASEQTSALSNIKMTSTATLIYTSDYDDVMPYVTSTADARKVITPYVKDAASMESPRKGCTFRYNVNVGGVRSIDIPSPAESVMWFEVTPADIKPVTAYCDGHANVVTEARRPGFDKALKMKFVRRKGMKPIRVHSN